jgi:hypothetical protein
MLLSTPVSTVEIEIRMDSVVERLAIARVDAQQLSNSPESAAGTFNPGAENNSTIGQ